MWLHSVVPAAAPGLPLTPQAQCAVLVECATHAIVAAQLGPYRHAQWALCEPLLKHLTADMLCLADQGFDGYAHWQAARATGAQLLWRCRVNQELPVMTPLLEQVQKHLEWLDAQMAQLQSDIDDYIDRHPQLRHDAELMARIPGIGRATVAKVLAYLGDIPRFSNANALAAFIGVTPRQRLSGTSLKGRTMMSRVGHQALRSALYRPELGVRRYKPGLKGFADRLKNAGLAPNGNTRQLYRDEGQFIPINPMSRHAEALKQKLPLTRQQEAVWRTFTQNMKPGQLTTPVRITLIGAVYGPAPGPGPYTAQ